MEVSPSACAPPWKSMQDKFACELKKVKEGKSGNAGPAYSPTWPLFDVLLFLADTVKHRKFVALLFVERCFTYFPRDCRSHTNISTSEVDDTATEDVQDDTVTKE